MVQMQHIVHVTMSRTYREDVCLYNAEELLDAHLLHSLHAKTPFECVIVTYSWGSEESLKHAEQLAKL